MSIDIGTRVTAVNSFQLKGQEGVVKFVGEVPGKVGIHVGVELDNPKGNMDGTVNNELLFECKPGYGVLLKPTQVKPLDSNETGAMDSGEHISDSPLLTPLNPGGQPAQRDMTITQSMMSGGSRIPQPFDGQQQVSRATESGAKMGWKERLENLRKKKQQEEQKPEDTKSEITPIQQQQQELKKEFGLQPGLSKNKEGKLQVEQEEVKKPADEEQESSLDEAKKPTLAGSKIGSGIGKGTKPGGGIKPPSKPTSTTEPIVDPKDAKKQQLKEKIEEQQKSLQDRKTETQKPQPTGQKVPTKKEQPKEEDKTDKKEAPASKIGAGSRASKIGAGAGESKIGGGLRPSTAKPGKEDENKLEGVKRTVAPRKPLKVDTIPEEDTPKRGASPRKTAASPKRKAASSPKRGNSPTKISSTKNLDSSRESTSQGFGGVNQAEYKKMEVELRKKKEEVYSLQSEVRELSQKIEQSQENYKQKLEEIENEYTEKMQQLSDKLENNPELAVIEKQHQAQIDLIKKNNKNNLEELQTQHKEEIEKLKQASKRQIEDLQTQIKDTSALDSASEREQSLSKQIQQLREDKQKDEKSLADQALSIKELEKQKAELQKELEARTLDIESIQLELELLKEEKEELLSQLTAASQVSDSEGLESLTQDELRDQNLKLRQAVTTMSMNFEVEKSKYEKKIKDLTAQNQLIGEYEKKLEDMDLLLEELGVKEQEIAEMEQKVQECLEYEQMVEEMTNELLKHETENEDLKRKVIELEEMNQLADELNENQEQLIKDLNVELADKEAQISNMDQERIQLEEITLDYEEQANKYKEKLVDMKKQAKLYEEQLESAYSTTDSKIKISTLLEKQNQLITRLREANMKDLELNNFRIEYWNEKMRSKVIEGFIPQRLIDETKMDSFEKIQLLGRAKNKATLLLREICERQLINIEQIYEDKEQREGQEKILIAICEDIVKLIECTNKIMYAIYKMPADKYIETTTKAMAWNKFITISQFCDNILNLLKEESLSTKFDISILSSAVKSVQDLQANVEFKYIEKTEDEKEEANSPSKSSQDRSKTLKSCPKVNVRNEFTKMAMAVIILACKTGQNKQELKQKCLLIYGRLFDLIMKIDFIEGNNSGEEYLNIEELNIDSRMSQKFNALSAVWTGNSSEVQGKDWTSVLESVERDITSLTNDFKFKKLNQKLEEAKIKLNIDDIFKYALDFKGPWTTISKKVREDLDDTNAMKDKIENLQEKLVESSKQFLTLKKEKEEMHLINSTLEKRLQEAIGKGERLPALEIEMKSQLEKERHLLQQIEQAKIEIENVRLREQELRIQLKGAEEKLENSPNKFGGSKRNSIALNPKTAKLNNFFGKLQQQNYRKDPFAQLAKQGSVSGTEIQKQMLLSEETFTNVIIELQNDRMRMRGLNMMERLNKLQKSEGALNDYIKSLREKKNLTMKLSKDEQTVLKSALTNVDSLKSKVKREMASQRVINLLETTKVDKSQNEVQGKEEKINYLILKAKEEVNDVVKVLFAKDSKFNQVRSSKKLSTKVQGEPDIEQVTIGSVNFSGAIPLLKERKNLILDNHQVIDLQRNLTIFQKC